MLNAFWKLYWKGLGWKVKGRSPAYLRKCVIAVAPHTSWRDVVIGMAARAGIPLPNTCFLGKKELFDGPFGWFFRWAGGLPVDRSGRKNTVEQVAELFREREELMLGISPEGTRQKVNALKTGFYYMAKQAGVPIVLAGLDFANKELIFSEPFYPDNETEDFKKIIAFFAPVKGYHPNKGLAHLQKKPTTD